MSETNRKHYAKEDARFATIAETNPEFRPRFHFWYSERESEQDAYFWFLQGQRVQQEDQMTKSGLGHLVAPLRKIVP